VSSVIVQLSIKSRTHTHTILSGPSQTLLNFNIDSFQLQANMAHTYSEFCQSCVLDADVCKALDTTGNHQEGIQ
jgi:hypothetical protein